jgi:hypothetical protein
MGKQCRSSEPDWLPTGSRGKDGDKPDFVHWQGSPFR